MAVAAARGRADGDENGVRVLHAGGFGGEGEPAFAHVAGDDLVEARFVDRHFAFVQARDLAGVLVDADDVVAEIGEAGAERGRHSPSRSSRCACLFPSLAARDRYAPDGRCGAASGGLRNGLEIGVKRRESEGRTGA
ncbi:MAG: hypothetical protein QM764_24600 [Chitinophagaceae bacterium]